MDYFYSASVMGYGSGRFWHSLFDFPNLPRVTKTITLNSRIGIPLAIIKYGNSVWNHVSLHNIGFYRFFSEVNIPNAYNTIVSLAGKDHEIEHMVGILNQSPILFGGIELNFSCPNVKDQKNINIPRSKYPMYLKLNYLQDPYKYDLNNIKGIRLNAIPTMFGGLSGEAAQKKNWSFIRKFNKEGLNVAGCSATEGGHLYMLGELGCKEIGLGSVVLTNPKLVESIGHV